MSCSSIFWDSEVEGRRFKGGRGMDQSEAIYVTSALPCSGIWSSFKFIFWKAIWIVNPVMHRRHLSSLWISFSSLLKIINKTQTSSLIPTTWFLRVGIDRNDLSIPIRRVITSKWLFGVGINLIGLIDKQELLWWVKNRNTNELQEIGMIRAAISLSSRWVIPYEFHKQVVCLFNDDIKFQKGLY